MSLSHLAILVIDVGGTHIKVMHNQHEEEYKFSSGKKMTPQKMTEGVLHAARDWHYDVVSMGCPMPINRGTPTQEPANLAKGWLAFNYAKAFDRPVKLINDAAMQALGNYHHGRMLFLGFGTGLGAAFIQDGVIVPLELAHLPYKKKTVEDYVGKRGMKAHGKKKWREHTLEVIELFQAAFEPEETVLGGGNGVCLKKLPPGCRAADNTNAFLGGFKMWESPYDQNIMTHQAGVLHQNLYC